MTWLRGNVGASRPESIHYYFVVERTPVGEAPVEVRLHWVGLALPIRYERQVEAPDPFDGFGVVTRTPTQILDGVEVSYSDCIDALSNAGRSGAAAYWEVRWEQSPFSGLVFQLGEGCLLPVEVARRLYPELSEAD
jgi:hypothetical protein